LPELFVQKLVQQDEVCPSNLRHLMFLNVNLLDFKYQLVADGHKLY